MKRTTLLTIDGIINLILGLLLLWYPQSLVKTLGLPETNNAFYPNILGGILLGIGITLFLERDGQNRITIGLGLGGAIAINLCGGIVLAGLLLYDERMLPLRGRIFLWSLVILLLGISIFELGYILLFKKNNTQA